MKSKYEITHHSSNNNNKNNNNFYTNPLNVEKKAKTNKVFEPKSHSKINTNITCTVSDEPIVSVAPIESVNTKRIKSVETTKKHFESANTSKIIENQSKSNTIWGPFDTVLNSSNKSSNSASLLSPQSSSSSSSMSLNQFNTFQSPSRVSLPTKSLLTSEPIQLRESILSQQVKQSSSSSSLLFSRYDYQANPPFSSHSTNQKNPIERRLSSSSRISGQYGQFFSDDEGDDNNNNEDNYNDEDENDYVKVENNNHEREVIHKYKSLNHNISKEKQMK